MKRHKYESLTQNLVELIESGGLKDGDRLPSLRDFAKSFHVSLNTAYAAYETLERNRYIRSVPQSGYYVSVRRARVSIGDRDTGSIDPDTATLYQIGASLESEGTIDKRYIDIAMASPHAELVPQELLRRYTREVTRVYREDSYLLSATPGFRQLCEQIAYHGLSFGTKFSPEKLIITSGCHESLYLALSTVLTPGAVVAIESPAPYPIPRILRSLGAKAVEIPCCPEKGMDLTALRTTLTATAVAAVVVNGNFQNPVGSLMPDARKDELVQLTATYGIPLIEDDVSGDLWFPAARNRPLTCKSFDRDGNVLYCSSFSKTISSGLRIGWLDAGRWFTEMENRKFCMNLGVSAIPQIALTLFLKEGAYNAHLRKNREIIEERMRSMRRALLEYMPEGTNVTDPSGGIVLWVTLPDGFDSRMLYDRALSSCMLIAPGSMFGSVIRHDRSFRLNASVWRDDTAETIRQLGLLAIECRKG